MKVLSAAVRLGAKLPDNEGVDVVNDGDTVVTGPGAIAGVVDGDTVSVVDGDIVFVVEGLHPVAASQLVVAVFTSTIRMVGSGRGPPSGAPAGGTTVPAETSDAVGQYPSVSGSHRISVTAGVDPVSVAAGAK